MVVEKNDVIRIHSQQIIIVGGIGQAGDADDQTVLFSRQHLQDPSFVFLLRFRQIEVHVYLQR
ncbi:hypothetical protein CMV60_05550 [Serratia marcescens]|nr:hypothetical protein CMV60_05550 [Serratia marcescens]